MRCSLLQMAKATGWRCFRVLRKRSISTSCGRRSQPGAHGIPFAEHARDHARIGAFVRAKINELNSGECNIPALMVFMDRCFETHVVHHDLKLGRDLLAAQALE